MKKLFLLFIIISLLIVIISGCNHIIPQDSEGEAEQSEGELTETGNNPGPAPNSGDGVSDGPGWDNASQGVNQNE